MEIESSRWLNKDFLTLALQGGERSGLVKIFKFIPKLAVAAGNNYTSHVFRVHIDYRQEDSPEDRSISVIVKAPIDKSATGECYDKIGLFEKEPKMYKTVLPALLEKLNCEFGPKYFYSREGYSLVLEDLIPFGYKLGDKFKQLDLKHCRKVMEHLGKYHAATIAYHDGNPNFMDTIQECFYREECPLAEQLKVLLMSALNSFLKSLDENHHQKIALYVTQRLDKVWNNVVDLCSPSKNTLNVLNHGDCWTNNLLFKYDDSGVITDVKFIDYQLVRYSSPVSDLLYFIWTSGDEEVRDNHQEDLFRIYLQTLNQTLEELNCQERFTREELETHLKSSSDWVLLILSYILPTIIFNTEENIHLEAISSEDIQSNGVDEKHFLTHSSKAFKKLLPGYLRQFERIITDTCKP